MNHFFCNQEFIFCTVIIRYRCLVRVACKQLQLQRRYTDWPRKLALRRLICKYCDINSTYYWIMCTDTQIPLTGFSIDSLPYSIKFYYLLLENFSLTPSSFIKFMNSENNTINRLKIQVASFNENVTISWHLTLLNCYIAQFPIRWLFSFRTIMITVTLTRAKMTPHVTTRKLTTTVIAQKGGRERIAAFQDFFATTHLVTTVSKK